MSEQMAIDWVSKLFNEPAGRLAMETARTEIPDWDSLGTLSLMSSLDSDFGILLADDEVQQITKVSDIVEILRRNGKVQ
jgi:acyl carrier protein